jgi:phosphatidylethanolamine/phosphatidyl-N-methylethanolamine N-methyltransferase
MEKDEAFNLDIWYRDNYNRINSTAVPNSLSNRILHKIIEKPFNSNLDLRILEVGANAGEHLPYVAADFLSYTMTDIRPLESNAILDELRSKHKFAGAINFQIADVQALPFENENFDRVISTCLFHHLEDPMEAFEEVRRVTKIGGTISILVPNDPGILYRILRGVTTLRTAKKFGLLEEVQLVHALEHNNHFLQLRTLLKYVFRKDRIILSSFPFKLNCYNINALTVFHVIKVL